ncbi:MULTISPECIES: DNA-directed RNA polymerase subunit omega [unclassified Psychrobacillus]|uniref:DNA-directed RNA polymerase subunit omega n=1 Tax=unclassified Psychrobacillus TaxID=2636677 RepID=UPI00146E8C59|nr:MULTISPECIES: DNA-directed RNA polymerase subunit omega [unclassified Psychrobacillus]MCM3356984.1 DNA-directed RNA polymerase subunit omega [Psychrobacillus sp. MER TA 171]NME04784.1 DNA-directed RNA polymerase subunit omega [Psychrobacillus sp. BL-248-WT-3]
MLYPSVDSLKNQIDSKYSLVSVASKRARQLQEEGGERLGIYVSAKQVGKALEEVAAGELKIESTNENAVYEDEV